MKNTILILAFVCFGAFIHAQATFSLKLTEVSNDGVNYVVSIAMQMNDNTTEQLKLGSSSLQFSFPEEALSAPVLHSSILESSLVYLNPTVTTPKRGQCSFNIELAVPNTGIEIAQSPSWTNLGEISFTIENPYQISPLTWSYNGGTTQTVVFLDDEATQIYWGDEEGSVVTGISERPISSSEQLFVFPNPNNGEELHVLANVANEASVTLEITDQLGKVVYSENYISHQNSEKEIKLNRKLESGIYFVNLIHLNGKSCRKFVVE